LCGLARARTKRAAICLFQGRKIPIQGIETVHQLAPQFARFCCTALGATPFGSLRRSINTGQDFVSQATYFLTFGGSFRAPVAEFAITPIPFGIGGSPCAQS